MVSPRPPVEMNLILAVIQITSFDRREATVRGLFASGCRLKEPITQAGNICSEILELLSEILYEKRLGADIYCEVIAHYCLIN